MSFESINLTELAEDVLRWKLEVISLNLYRKMQVDENIKLSKRIDELEKSLTNCRTSTVFLVDEIKDRIYEQESQLSKLHDIINLEDRITASDVLCRLTELERFQEITRLQYKKNIDQLGNDKKPHKCPVCDGSGGVKHPLTGLILPAKCHACEGKGIVWR